MRNRQEQYRKIIEDLLDEIESKGVFDDITGGSDEYTLITRSDRTVPLKNLIASYKTLTQIFPQDSKLKPLEQIRNEL